MTDIEHNNWKILVGDCRERLEGLPDESVHMIWTSPPYFGLRDYGEKDQIGLELTPDEFVEALVTVFAEARRVLRDDGTLWLNLGDSYASSSTGSDTTKTGLKPKDLIGIPWRVAKALQDDGWYLRSDIIWAKGISGHEGVSKRVYQSAVKNGVSTSVAKAIVEDLDLYVGNPMPESVKDRPSSAHEHIFLFSKNKRYFYDHIAIREPVSAESVARVQRGHHRKGHKWGDGPGNQTIANDLSRALHPAGRNRRDVWCIPTKPFRGAHFATAPEALVAPCIKAGTSEAGCCPGCEAPYVRKNSECKTSCACNNDPFFVASSDPVPCTVLDLFAGAATTLLVAEKLGRRSIGIELNPEYAVIASERLAEYSRNTKAPWEDGYIPKEIEEDSVIEEMSFDDLLG